MPFMSRPLQVYLEEAELERLEAWARRHGWTKSQAVRVALRALTRSAHEDPLLGASGMVDGLPPDLSDQFDRYLAETFVAEPRPSYRARRPRPTVRR
jgi:hypothetical protein